MSDRTVKTDKGAARFGQDIGETILADGTVEPNPRPVTVERLRSLQSQLSIATSTGNTALQKVIQGNLSVELRTFSKGKTPAEVLSALSPGTE